MRTKKNAPPKLHCRWMIRRDMTEVVEIGQHTEEDYLTWLRQRNVIGAVVEECVGDGVVVAFAIYELHKHRLHVLEFGIKRKSHPDVAANLWIKLKDKLSNHRRRRLTVDVPETDLATLMQLRGEKFLAVKVEREQFGNADGIRMEFAVDGVEEEEDD